MDFFKKSDAVGIYDLFISRLNRVNSLFLLGLYYSSNGFTKNDIEKKIIISQQLLTFLKRNSFPELDNGDSIERLFLDSNDKLNENCHPDFLIDEEIFVEIDTIKELIDVFNSQLEQPIIFSYIQEKEKKNVSQSQASIDIPETEDDSFKESDNAKESIERFLSKYPNLGKKKKNKYPRTAFLLGIRNGFFIAHFLNNHFRVQYVEKEEEKARRIRKLPYLVRFKMDYLDCPEAGSLDAFWSYNIIARMKKDEIIQCIKNIEIGLVDDGYAFISFMYGNGHKTINNHYYTLMDEVTIQAIVSKAKKLGIVDMWTREYTRKDGTLAKRLNVIIQKNKYERELKVFNNEKTDATLPQSIDIQKLQLISRLPMSSHLEPGNEIEQRITISKDGRIWITRNEIDSIEPELSLRLKDKKIISIDKDIAEQIFFKVYRSIFLTEREGIADVGMWNLTITATNEDIYTAEGSFGVPVMFREQDLCVFIREKIQEEGLWIFDNLME